MSAAAEKFRLHDITTRKEPWDIVDRPAQAKGKRGAGWVDYEELAKQLAVLPPDKAIRIEVPVAYLESGKGRKPNQFAAMIQQGFRKLYRVHAFVEGNFVLVFPFKQEGK